MAPTVDLKPDAKKRGGTWCERLPSANALRAMASMSFRTDDDLAAEARGAVIVVRSTNPKYSRDALLRRGLELVLAELRKLHNGGERFDPVPAGALKRGNRGKRG